MQYPHHSLPGGVLTPTRGSGGSGQSSTSLYGSQISLRSLSPSTTSTLTSTPLHTPLSRNRQLSEIEEEEKATQDNSHYSNQDSKSSLPTSPLPPLSYIREVEVNASIPFHCSDDSLQRGLEVEETLNKDSSLSTIHKKMKDEE